MTTAATTVEVAEYLARYIQAFNSNTGTEIAKFYLLPCLLIRGDGSIHAFSSRSELEAFCQAVVDQYYAQGCRDWRYANLAIAPMDSRCLLATVDWEPLRADGTPIRKWRQTYQLLRAPEGIRFVVSTSYAP